PKVICPPVLFTSRMASRNDSTPSGPTKSLAVGVASLDSFAVVTTAGASRASSGSSRGGGGRRGGGGGGGGQGRAWGGGGEGGGGGVGGGRGAGRRGEGGATWAGLEMGGGSRPGEGTGRRCKRTSPRSGGENPVQSYESKLSLGRRIRIGPENCFGNG